MMNRILVLFVLLGALVSTAGTDSTFSYADYASVLRQYVDAEGNVDYAGLLEDRATLDRFTEAIATLDLSTVDGWSTEQRLAFWINAYNALTLKAVVDHYPVKSIKHIGTPLKSVWDALRFIVAGRELTLNQIEHEILRKEFDEPYVHMTINCASIGCPPLLNEPFLAERLAAQFDRQTRRFLARASNFTIDPADRTVRVSSIFKWFGGDFVARYGQEQPREGLSPAEDAIIAFVARHVDEDPRRYLDSEVFGVGYLDYDWNLNDRLLQPAGSIKRETVLSGE